MKEFYKRGKGLFVAFLSALLIITQLGLFSPVAAYAQEAGGNENQTAEVKATKAATKADGTTVLTFTSDTHNNAADAAANRMDGWLDNVQRKIGTVEAMGFCGDMGHYNMNGDPWWNAVQKAMDVVTKHGLPGIYTTGNHEYMNGSYSSSLNNATAKKFLISSLGKEGDNYIIYCLGSTGQSETVTTDQISKLRSFLESQGTDKPIIILVHFPLHHYSSRTTSNASSVIDLLNERTDKGQKIIYLWGHNHTMSDPNYDQVFTPGSTINTTSSGGSKTLKFHYAAAGCMSGSEYSGGSTYVKGKGLVLTIDDSTDKLTMTYLDENGNDVTEGGGAYIEGDTPYIPDDDDDTPTGDTVSITPSTDNPETSIKINVGDTLTINTTNGSSSSAYDFTASLSNSSVAQIQGNSTVNISAGSTGKFTVKGLTEGTVDVTIQNSNTYGSQYTRKGIVHVTVGNGGSTPVDPPTGDSVSITPSTDNPETSIKINVGDTLTINTTNGSSNSAYDFTATLSKSGIAEIQGSSTINIGTGATGQFTVKGLANGTVDITIQNSNTYGSSYTRKGVIHLTVGEGGGGDTPVDPPTGDTVNITPTTDNPEQSIKINVGDTLTINTTNGSTSSAYDFTASLSKSGIAEIQGNATQNIAAGATAAFTVKGLAEGTVDITIQNSNQYGSQYARKGVIHLTVGEGGGGEDPVDPPTGDSVSITPSTDHPEESIKINVGDTLTINTTNGSSNSAYDFTATLSKSGIAEIQGNSTINIGMGATGQFTVKGLANGTVDITISNNSQYGDQYARRGVIHLTVGEGGGGDDPVDPPTGDSVDITPSTDNPESSIKINVGDTLDINVTNGSSNSGYDFTATLSKSGIAEIQGNATQNIAQGGKATFTVKGLAAGTVDITISNNNTQYGDQYVRKGVIHLTVAEGTTHDHEWDNGKETTAPTCTQDGVKTYTCSVCGQTKTEAIKALGHDYKEVAGTGKAATCTEAGKEADQKCDRCGDEISGKEIPATDHKFSDWRTVTDPDCTKTGMKVRVCRNCGKNEYEDIAALGHDYKDVAGTAIEVTCTTDGREADQKCDRCGDEVTGKAIPALGHDFGEWQTVNEADCTHTGDKARGCKRCAETEWETIPALGHDFGEWTTFTEPDCTHDGEKARACKRCKETEFEPIPALGHEYQEVEGSAKAATCTEAGKEADQKCTRCGDVITGKEIPALGHDFSEWQTARAATETETGLKIRFCKRCGDSEEEVIPKITPSKPDVTPTPTPTPDSKGEPKKEESKSTVPTTIPAEISPSNPVSAASVDKQILNAKTDGDPKGSVFNLLQAKGAAKSKTSVKVSWKKVTGAKKYIVYGNKCGTKYRFKKIKEVTGTSFTQKGLKKGTYYKYLIVAVSGNKALATSKGIHVATKGGKVGNSKSVTTKAKNNKVTLKKGKTFKLGAKAVAQSKKLKVKKHRAIAYESSNKKIATVTKKGVIKGVKKGTCYVYAYAQNGVSKKIKVTVK